MDPKNLVLVTGTANPKLAEDISKILGIETTCPITYFSDGEIRVKGLPNLRRKHVFIVQPTCPPVNNSIIELILMIDAAQRASADEITAIIPYFGYARQDRKEQPRVPVSASVIANTIINTGADRIVTIDVHSHQSQGFIQAPWDNLFASFTLIPELKKLLNPENLVIVSPDKGGMKAAAGYAEMLGTNDVALVYKHRDIHVNNQSKAFAMIGDVAGKDVLIVDDMLDSGGTIFGAAEYIKQAGAKSIRVAVAHGLFTGECLTKLSASDVTEVITTDSVQHRAEVVAHPKIKIISVADLLSQAITKIENGDSVSEDLIIKK